MEKFITIFITALYSTGAEGQDTWPVQRCNVYSKQNTQPIASI